MRVTQNTNFNTVRDSIGRAKGRMENLQMQGATLKKLNTPSDNPIGAAKVLETRTEKVNNDQFLSNINLAESFLNITDHALGDLADIVVRAKEIAVGQASGASSTSDTRLSVAEEVTQLFQQAVATANRKVGDRYIFGGYKTREAPVNPDGRYIGDTGQIMTEIGNDVFIAMNITGLEAFNTNPKASADIRGPEGEPGRNPGSEEGSGTADGADGQNVNVFDEIQRFRIALLTGDVHSIRDSLDRFDQVHAHIVSARAKVGSRIMGMRTAAQAMERHNLTNAQLTTTLEDADMVQVMSDLAKEETVYRSSLSSSQRLIQPTLLDFLK